MGILSLPSELICHIAEGYLDKPKDVYYLLLGSNRRLAQVLIPTLNSFAIKRENSVGALFWASIYRQSGLVDLLVRYGNGVQVVDGPGGPALARPHADVVAYVLREAPVLILRDCRLREYTTLEWAVMGGRLDRIMAVLKAGAPVDAGALTRIRWTGSSEFGGDQDAYDRNNSAILRLLFAYTDRMQDVLDEVRQRGVIPLLDSAAVGHHRVVSLLLQYGVSASIRDDHNGFTPLHLAARNGHVGVALTLLSHGAEVSAWDRDGNSPLHHAVRSKQLRMVETLLRSGAIVNEVNLLEDTPLNIAVEGGDISSTTLLLQYGADPAGKATPRKRPLHLAVGRDSPVLAELLIAAGAEVDLPSPEGTPLMVAVEQGSMEMTKLLLAKGASVDPVCGLGNTLMHLAANKGGRGIVWLLTLAGVPVGSRNAWGETPLHLAAGSGRDEVVTSLLLLGSDVNSKSNGGETPLHLAAKAGYAGVVTDLIALGAIAEPGDGEVAIRSQSVKTACLVLRQLHGKVVRGLHTHEKIQAALLWAAAYGYDEYVEVLLERGGDPAALDSRGRAPLLIAMANGHVSTTRALLQNSHDMSITDNQGRTPLHLAVARREMDGLVKPLLKKGANVNAMNNNGETPLHIAAMSGRAYRLVPLLVTGGSDVDLNVRDRYGRTVLSIVSQKEEKKRQLFGFLVERGADCMLKG